jgi:hypothetical protein
MRLGGFFSAGNIDELDYALNFARLHQLAREAGTRFLRRGEN